MSKNINIIPRNNPLILEIKIEPDSVINGFQAVSPQSLSAIRAIINKTLLVRHYKKLILDVDKIELGGSALLAKILMCYEKAISVKCEVYSFNATPRLYMQHTMARLEDLVPVFTVEQTPKPEEYDKFFGFDYEPVDILLNSGTEESSLELNEAEENKESSDEGDLLEKMDNDHTQEIQETLAKSENEENKSESQDESTYQLST